MTARAEEMNAVQSTVRFIRLLDQDCTTSAYPSAERRPVHPRSLVDTISQLFMSSYVVYRALIGILQPTMFLDSTPLDLSTLDRDLLSLSGS